MSQIAVLKEPLLIVSTLHGAGKRQQGLLSLFGESA